MQQYLANSTYIDWHHADIQAQAAVLAEQSSTQLDLVRRCFEFVRDQIKHSWDFQTGPVTCKASDVLNTGVGYCYAKSHLLAALLRGNGVPTGLCYQRLTISDDQPPFCLHGLNAVYLQEFGWYRLDARGNNANVEADFCPPVEKLAYPIISKGEADLPEIWAEPLPVVVNALDPALSFMDVADHLPDVELAAIGNKG